jgi:hypothetical protein
MLPFAYEWHWDLGHFIFFGLFYGVLTVNATTLAVAGYRALKNARHAAHIGWHEAFHDLPATRLRCRYELSGRVDEKQCDHEFDCGSCDFHVLRKTTPDPVRDEVDTASAYGFAVEPERKYHRGHTWVRELDDGTYAVGLTDFALRVLGGVREIVLPTVGTALEANGHGFDVKAGGPAVPILSPVTGEVVETGSLDGDFLLKVKPTGGPELLEQLFEGRQAVTWAEAELENLKRHLGVDKSPFPGNRDGLPAAFPGADWDAIHGDVFLSA